MNFQWLKWERILALGWGVPLRNGQYVGSVLRCLRKSYESQAYRAHCWTDRRATTMEHDEANRTIAIRRKGLIRTTYDRHSQPIPDPVNAPIWLHPCRSLGGWDQLTTQHPTSIRAQIEAGMVERECRWCPRLEHLDHGEQQMWGRPRLPGEAHGT
jgi:hypothetical protein